MTIESRAKKPRRRSAWTIIGRIGDCNVLVRQGREVTEDLTTPAMFSRQALILITGNIPRGELEYSELGNGK